MVIRSQLITIFYLFLILYEVSGSIDGVSYLDPLNQRNKVDSPKDDPCNPLYWYPQPIPEYCNRTKMPPLPPPPMPLPLPPPPPPSPVPIPGYPYPIPIPYPMMPQPMPLPIPLPYGVPIIPTPVLPFPTGLSFPPPPDPCNPPCMPPGAPPLMPGPLPPPPAPMLGPYPPPMPMPAPLPNPFPIQVPYSGPFQPSPSGYVFEQVQQWRPPRVQGMPGVVNKDGGINILPFSDAYSDFIEKHKQKMIRKKLEIFLNDIEKDRKRGSRSRNRKRDYEN